MKKADKRNNMAPSTRPSFKAAGNSVSPIFSTAKLKAANVPGDDAFLIGLMNFSNSSATHNTTQKSSFIYELMLSKKSYLNFARLFRKKSPLLSTLDFFSVLK